MDDDETLIAIEGSTLAAAFPSWNRPTALRAAFDVASRLDVRQWADRFAVRVDGRTVQIPVRLHLSSHHLAIQKADDAWLLARALQTRSCDDFERQRAVRDLLTGFKPWAAPFIVALIGEYLVEILDEISAATTPEIE